MASPSDNIHRPLAAFPEDIWGDRFLEARVDPKRMEAYAKEMDPLKEQVRAMLLDDSFNDKHKLDLIDVVQRLGISYYFEKEIGYLLEHIFEIYSLENDYDLYTIGVHFRVFRQHGYKMPCDVFNKFKDSEGKLQEELTVDIKGILSLYEASHLRMHNEEFMDEVLDLTTTILNSIALESKLELEDPCLYNQVVHATKQALHMGVVRVETRRFISFYEEDKSHDGTLLRLAMVDFNMLQLLHRQELSQTIKWWKSLDVKTQLPYARDRSLECHYWAMAMYFEERYSRGRIFMAKVFGMISILDDTYDAYGTIEELRLLTQAFERWDKNMVDELPCKMKLVFDYVYNLYDEFEKEMVKEGRDYAACYAKAGVLDIIRGYYTEAIWCYQRYIPRYEEYMTNAARITSVGQIVPTSAMLGMEPEMANESAFKWVVDPVPRVIRGAEVVGRLMDDIVTHQEEQRRPGLHVASAVECYMHEHGVDRDEAVAILRQIIKDAWKDMNEDLIKPTPVSSRILELPFNIGRLVDSLYKDMDGYTYSAKVMKNEALLVYSEAFDI